MWKIIPPRIERIERIERIDALRSMLSMRWGFYFPKLGALAKGNVSSLRHLQFWSTISTA
jgi:hypothetical protein